MIIELPASDDPEKLKAAYLAIKDLDPEAIVITAGLSVPKVVT